MFLNLQKLIILKHQIPHNYVAHILWRIYHMVTICVAQVRRFFYGSDSMYVGYIFRVVKAPLMDISYPE